MIRRTLLGVVLLLTFAVGAEAQVIPQAIGAQWESRPTYTSCIQPNAGGSSCFVFPTGGQIYGITWESTLKNATDVLWTLIMSSTGVSAEVPLFYTFQQPTSPIVIKEPNFGGRYVTVPPGWYVWVSVGSDYATFKGEMNVTLWTNTSNVQHYCPTTASWAFPGYGC